LTIAADRIFPLAVESRSMKRVAIIGAGVAGASVAYALRDADASVSVFEKTPDIGGRMATESTHGCTYDPGANYVKSDDPIVSELITETLNTNELIDVAEPVWTFDGEGTISEGQDTDEHKWTYEDGIAQLATELFTQGDTVSVSRETRIETISREGEHWSLSDASGEDFGSFDVLVLTPPAPQSAALIDGMQWETDLRKDLYTAVDSVEYRTICSVMAQYPFELDVPYYALVNTDREHEIGWVSREECKSGHVPDGECLLVIQMAPDWSAQRIDDSPEIIANDATELTADLFDDDRLSSPGWTETKSWRNALPDTRLEIDVRKRIEQDSLYLAGDWVAGDGRAHLALKNGLSVGKRIFRRAFNR
jgi:renalase